MVKCSILADEEEEAMFLEHLKFIRMALNCNDSSFVTMLLDRIKKEVYMTVILSLIERSQVLPRAILIETVWLFIGFFAADNNIINELIDKRLIECLAQLISAQDPELLENVSLQARPVFCQSSPQQQQRSRASH